MTALIRQARQTNQVGQIKRSRPTKLELEHRREALVRLAEEVKPASVRHIYYRAVAAGLVEKKESGYNKVVYDLGILRSQGRIPYNWIVDNGRRGHFPLVSRSPESALRRTAHLYRRDPWQYDDAPNVEIWCESRSIAGVLMDLKDQYAVPIFPTGGQTSETFAYEAATSYRRTTIVLYAGDYDPAGLQCGAQLEAKLRKHADPEVNIEFRLLSITDAQAATMQALGTPPKSDYWVDQHGQRHDFVGQAIELEAVDPNVMRRLFAEAIEQIAYDHIGHDIFTENREIEAGERDRLEELAEGWWSA
ncbi:hypothetical protein [Nocardioides sp. AE5]|uniref:hypothetical protein n=1 Tax=Nocardioides sp. AE5 TaxID=2962573 RepID=UPI002880C19C|nr:hypothetical protein [Nocardioides sp. AE5]MDT0201344.1 hypothetical protein [Nocardioides sp. AE5]